MDLRSAWVTAKYNLGLMKPDEVVRTLCSKREAAIAEIPQEGRQAIRSLVDFMDQTSSLGDIGTFFKAIQELSIRADDVLARYGNQLDEETKQTISFVSGSDALGYRPNGARSFKWFINPFAAFSFFAEQHYAAKAAIDIIVTEVINDGYSLVHDRKLAPERVQYIEGVFDSFDLDQLRIKLLRHRLAYGNALILPHKNPLQNVQKLELLVMDRCMPIWDRSTERIIAWDYWTGYHSQQIPIDKLLHLNCGSLKYPDLGLPPLSPLVVDMESDLAASSLHAISMFKAGMIGTIIGLENPGETNPSNAKNADKLAARLQKQIQMQFSGIKGGYSVLVSNYIKQVHKLSQMGDFEASFLKTRMEIAKAICTILKVPPEKISINRSAGLQYQAALVEDSINASFDKAIAAYMAEIDGFINKEIIQGVLGIDDITIIANGRYGSLTLNGARAFLTASQTGAMFDYNEGRTIFYGLPPLPPDDPRGYQLADNSKNRDAKATPPQYSKGAPITVQEDPDDVVVQDPEEEEELPEEEENEDE